MAQAIPSKSWPLAVAWWLLLICLLVARASTIVQFGMRYAGSDDVLFWNVANDFAHGIFREPYVYGQNYNPALESLLAVPLLWFGVPMHMAMPVTTSFLALAPFLSFSLWHKRRKEWAAACGFLAVPLLLPVQWDLITTMTRGFVTGIAVLAALPWALHIRDPRWRAAAVGFILGLALYINPNAAIFGLPFMVWFLLQAQRRMHHLLFLALGSIPPLAIQSFSMRFYALRPWRIVHRIDDWRMEFHPLDLIPEGLQHLGLHFQWLMPVAWEHGAWVLIALAITVCAALWQHNRIAALAIASVFPLVLFSLAFAKVHDGFRHVLYPYDRMFLAIPLLMAWALAALRWHRVRAVIVLTTLAGLIFTPLKLYHLPIEVANALRPMTGVPVGSWPYGEFTTYAQNIAETARCHNASLVVALDGPDGMLHLALSYGGDIVTPELPPTLYVGLDRRWWRREEEAQARHAAILVVGGDEALWKHAAAEGLAATDISGQGEMMHLVRPGGMTMTDVMERLGRRW